MIAAFISSLLAAMLVAVTKTNGDADVLARATTVLAELQKGTLDRSELTPALSALYTPDILARDARTLPKSAPLSFALRQKTDVDGVTTYVYRVRFNEGILDYTFGFDDATYAITKLFTRPGPPG
jgi:hypothetical protein